MLRMVRRIYSPHHVTAKTSLKRCEPEKIIHNNCRLWPALKLKWIRKANSEEQAACLHIISMLSICIKQHHQSCTSMTTRIPERSLSSLISLMPSILCVTHKKKNNKIIKRTLNKHITLWLNKKHNLDVEVILV